MALDEPPGEHLFSTRRLDAATATLAGAEADALEAESDDALEEALLAALHASLVAASLRIARSSVPHALPALLAPRLLSAAPTSPKRKSTRWRPR